jgi:hypothetical protein
MSVQQASGEMRIDSSVIPALDRRVPSHLETATFGAG